MLDWLSLTTAFLFSLWKTLKTYASWYTFQWFNAWKKCGYFKPEAAVFSCFATQASNNCNHFNPHLVVRKTYIQKNILPYVYVKLLVFQWNDITHYICAAAYPSWSSNSCETYEDKFYYGFWLVGGFMPRCLNREVQWKREHRPIFCK